MNAVPTTRLEEAFTAADSIRSVNFFNGRLLTGEDLRREQLAEQARLARLGEATGAGVVRGLEVERVFGSPPEQPVVTVKAGAAVARSGLVLELPVETDVSLARTGPRPGSEPGGLFADCEPFTTATYSAGAGVYVLTIGPASKGEGTALVSGLQNEAARCNVAFSVEGVRFRLLRVALPASELADEARLRNRVAYRFFGAEELDDVERDPFGPRVTEWGLADRLRETCLSDDEVPLATIAWKAGAGIRFVDLWSVRRRLVRTAPTDDWPALVSDRRIAEGEARFLQFQEQLGELRREAPNAATVTVRDAFTRLPPLGYVPVGPGVGPFLHRGVFFGGLKTREPAYVEAPKVASLVRASFAYPPIDLDTTELVWLYLVRDNVLADAATSYLIFAHGQMPYAADARFDLAYWDYANYALMP